MGRCEMELQRDQGRKSFNYGLPERPSSKNKIAD